MKILRAIAVFPMAACVAVAVELISAGFLLSLMHGLAKALGAPLKDWQHEERQRETAQALVPFRGEIH